MSELLAFDFMQNAFLGSLVVSLICGVIGTLIVINRMVFIAGGIAHGSYGGVGLALYLGLSPLLGASVFALILGGVMAYLTRQTIPALTHSSAFCGLLVWPLVSS